MNNTYRFTTHRLNIYLYLHIRTNDSHRESNKMFTIYTYKEYMQIYVQIHIYIYTYSIRIFSYFVTLSTSFLRSDDPILVIHNCLSIIFLSLVNINAVLLMVLICTNFDCCCIALRNSSGLLECTFNPGTVLRLLPITIIMQK